MTIRGETIWVTGASSGIGRELVKQLAVAGNHVIASARNRAALNQLAEQFAQVDVVVFDVTDKQATGRVKQELAALTHKLDRVILNAGNCEYLDPVQPRWEIVQELLAVNFLGMVNSVDICLDLLKQAPSPQIVGVSSQAILAPFPRAEAYGASKAAVSYFLDALRLDVKQFNIDITVVLPGFVDTPLTERNTFAMPFIVSVDSAAKRMLRAIQRRDFHYIFPRRLRFLLWLVRAMPRLWLRLSADHRGIVG